MNKVPNSDLRAAALAALQAWTVDSPEQAARLLQSWARRSEMTDTDVTAVLDVLFPEPGHQPARSADFREGYAEGFLDCLLAAREMRRKAAEAEKNPAERLVDEAAARMAAEHQQWLKRIQREHGLPEDAEQIAQESAR
ncbi:hypothetical protein [Actinoplanes subtropicus]|uniref:hypothetical protein n=1 Tax=Actinoplanes subtropicus TaxID=543632 RepID=UPI0004C44706|nr:hypothetical protein [Actinoplanes subtropicus]